MLSLKMAGTLKILLHKVAYTRSQHKQPEKKKKKDKNIVSIIR